MDEVEYEEITLLEEFRDALVGCVFDPEGSPIPCYKVEVVWEQLALEGYTADQADEYIEHLTAGIRVVWVHPLELQPGFEPDNRPHLRIVN